MDGRASNIQRKADNKGTIAANVNVQSVKRLILLHCASNIQHKTENMRTITANLKVSVQSVKRLILLHLASDIQHKTENTGTITAEVKVQAVKQALPYKENEAFITRL